jgi:hypothetical protein
VTDCVAVDDGGDAVEGNPQAGAPWMVTRITGADSLTGIACSSAAQCVAVDDAGSAWAGANPAEPTGRAPTVFSQTSALNGSSGASLGAQVNPHGVLVTDCELQWATDSAYNQEQSEPCDQSAGGGTAPVSVSAELSGLSPGTTYHYRFVAENTAGITHGYDSTFTTPGAASPTVPQPSPVTTGAAPVVTGAAPSVSRTRLATLLELRVPAHLVDHSYRVTVHGHSLRLTFYLGTTGGHPLAGEPIEVIIGKRMRLIRTGGRGRASLVLGRLRSETVKLRFVGTAQDDPSTMTFRIVVARRSRS